MNAYQELAPRFDTYRDTIKAAKAKKGYSLSTLAEESGVAYSAVSRLCDGTQSEPKLFNAVALCKVLGISIDDTFGLRSPTEENAEQLRERIHWLELKNAELRGENDRLEATNQILQNGIDARRPLIYILLSLCAALVCGIGVYLVIDANIRNAGLIRFGNFSPGAWVCVAVIVGVLASVVIATLRITRKQRK